jgi:DNA polymerase III delta prime subunit
MNNEQILQYATVKIQCNGETGTALLYSPGETFDYMYILTAKHCLAGKNFDKQFQNKNIRIEKIFNPLSGKYYSCGIMETDKVICTENNDLDLALIIIPKSRIEELSGLHYSFQIMDRPGLTGECMIRGFAEFNSGKEDRSYKLNFTEGVKDKPEILSLHFNGSLDTRYQSALDNVQGLSGSGLFSIIKGHLFLLGIIHTYEEKSRFFATKVTVYNHLVIPGHQLFHTVEPEENDAVLNTFDLIGVNNEAIKIKTRDTIGDLHIVRDISTAKKILKEQGMIVFSGKPGVGKSAMAKGLINDLEKSKDTTVITFTAEQLFSPTLNEALVKAGYNATIHQIISSPLSRKQIIFWVESFEKLVEARFGGAFTELLALTKQNKSLGLVVTIREYFLQKFKIFYQHELPSGEIYYPVNEFNDVEMKQIETGLPELNLLLTNSKLSHLLRTPYYLDKALRILPQLDSVENLDEAEFKRLLWEEIVEAGDRQRGVTFLKIAAQRAIAMELYTYYEPDAITDALVRDNILHVEKGELKNRFAPAHDILEDWALVLKIKQQKRDAGTPLALLQQLSNGPAMRRAFRLYLEDFYKQQPQVAEDFSSEVLSNSTIDQSWKDELIIYILRSENASPLFHSFKRHLLENEGAKLYHFIQLLRTCCKALRKGAEDFDDLVPAGSGWDAMINFIYANKVAISAMPKVEDAVKDILFDWGRQLPVFNPQSLPSSARSAALLLLDYIIKHQSLFRSFRRSNSYAEAPDQALRLFLRLTSVAQAEVKKLIDAVAALPTLNDDVWTNNNVLEYTKNFIVDGVDGEQVSKYFPETVLALALDKWIEKPVVHRPESLFSQLKIEHDFKYFGLEDHLRYEASSAYQTFFYWMLLYHPDMAVSFINDFLNRAFEKNQQGRLRKDDTRIPITLKFKEHGDKSYYGNYDYWTFYRGHNVYDAVIQSLLMALEKGLLDLAREGITEHKAKKLLETLVLNSNNVAVLAVISSVIQAHPKLLDATTAVLLGSRPLLEWDGSRYATDIVDKEYYGTNAFLRSERLKSNRLQHRFAYHRGLIGFIADYMFVHQDMNQQLFEQLDLLWAAVEQNDFMWRKALTEMDARKYKIESVNIPGYDNHVALTPGYDTELAEVISTFGEEKFPRIGMIWASKVFKREFVEDSSYEAWKIGYEDLAMENSEFNLMTAPGKMACLGFRDYFEQLEESEKLWCKDKIIELASQQLRKDADYIGMLNSGFMDKDAVLYGVSLLLKLEPETIDETEIRALIFQLLITYIDGNVKKYLLLGIAENIWQTRPGFAINCWYGVLAFVGKKQEEYRELEQDRLSGNGSKGYRDRPDKEAAWITELVRDVISDTPFTFNAEPHLDRGTRMFLDDALQIVPLDTEIEPLKTFVASTLNMHLVYLGTLGQRDDNDFWESRDVFKSFYANYLLSRNDEVAGQLFMELLDIMLLDKEEIDMVKITEYIRDIVKQVVLAVNAWPAVSKPITRFWHLWYILRNWIDTTKRSYLIPTFLLEIGWYDSVDDWDVLKGEKIFYKEFILTYGNNTANQCIDLLAGPGFKSFMPESISWLATLLKYETKDIVLNSKLERFIHRAFFGYGTQIKDSKSLTRDFLSLLDFLIARGSPKAYMLKEEMIQYK